MGADVTVRSPERTGTKLEHNMCVTDRNPSGTLRSQEEEGKKLEAPWAPEQQGAPKDKR